MRSIRFFLMPLMIFAVVFSSCIKKTSSKEVEENLKASMTLFLNHQPRLDTSRVKFNVLSVVYFEEKNQYLCEFRVNMKEKEDNIIHDTTGTMNAVISKDFKDVTRRN